MQPRTCHVDVPFFAAITLLLCVAYGMAPPTPLVCSASLKWRDPPSNGLLVGFMLGLQESFLYGVYAGLVFCPIYNLLYQHWGED